MLDVTRIEELLDWFEGRYEVQPEYLDKVWSLAHEAINVVPEILATLRQQQERIEVLTEAAEVARTSLDLLMGDSDIEGDNSIEFRAMQLLSATLAAQEPQEERDD